MQSTNPPPENPQAQFSIRTLLVVTMVVAIIVSVAQLLMRDTIAIIIAFIFSFLLALTGFGMLFFACLFALAVLSSCYDGNRLHNLIRCLQLSFIGLLALAPMAIWFFVARLLPFLN